MLGHWKAYATRKLRIPEKRPDRTYWTHGGSARRILTAERLARAMDYVLRGQGDAMEVYCADMGATPRSRAGLNQPLTGNFSPAHQRRITRQPPTPSRSEARRN